MRCVVFLSITLLFSGSGQLKVLRQGARPATYTYFLLDYSGSTTFAQRDRMINYFLMCVRRFSDFGQIKVIVFDDTMEKYSTDWVPLPNPREVRKIVNWLKLTKLEGSTDIAGAVVEALKEPIKKAFTIFLITDGEHNVKSLHQRISAQQKKRDFPVPIILLGIDLADSKKSTRTDMLKISKDYGGMLLVDKDPPPQKTP